MTSYFLMTSDWHPWSMNFQDSFYIDMDVIKSLFSLFSKAVGTLSCMVNSNRMISEYTSLQMVQRYMAASRPLSGSTY